ncbi:OmpH family outer membrane protein [Gammaproteobacteria bacterium LSUCC0057]|uniref:OmpH family outer membrane protein n=1 Tax=Gammaproteobacteria bacterium LSUCC0057 TaxID=2559237 RepID=A0A4Y8UK89_9GAMM|nr:OmpH family outer membrane protein [Gammaproteobacteria bacterium LSUCC0057]
MLTVKKTLTAILLVAAAGVAQAADKIAVVDIQRAIFGSELAQQRAQAAESGADFVALKAKYESAVADLQTMAKEAEANRMTWSQEQVASYQKKAEYTKADADLAMRKLQAETQQLQQSIFEELRPKASQALEEVVKEEGITLLLKAESVMIAGPEHNITAKVAERLNKITQ